jgi:enoyl-CoA hydratase/carnithine racemase
MSWNAIIPVRGVVSIARTPVTSAERLVNSPTLALRAIKRLVYQGQRAGSDLRTHLDAVSSLMAITGSSADHREALNAIQEKRPPVFKGR